MTRSRPTIALLAFLTVAAALPAQAAPPGTTIFTENFEEGNNTGGWSLGNEFLEAIDATGGNPGAYLHFPNLDTFAPRARTTLAGSAFTGDYRAAGVSQVGIDFVLHYVDFSSADRPVAVMLTSTGADPEDLSDDCTVYFLGHKPGPSPNSRWRSYSFRIPSESTVLPRGWKTFNCALDPDAAWNAVIGDVDQLTFHVGDPELFFIFQVWDIGIDNPTITFGTAQQDPTRAETDRIRLADDGGLLQRR
jgi:hypothetical protein